MKRLALAVLLTGLGSTAFAQSSVTLFGFVDVNVRSVKNSGSDRSTSLADDGINSGRWGIRGVENLGGGYAASFWLESDLNPDTGTVNAVKLFSRQSTVSLHAPYGELRLGRHYNPTGWNKWEFDPWSVIGVGGSAQIARYSVRQSEAFYRSDNMISYYLPPNLGGVYGQLAYAFDEGGLSVRYTGGRLGYKAGPINVAAAYGIADQASSEYRQMSIGASYVIGQVRLTGSYEDEKLTTPVPALAPFAGSETRWLVGAIWTAGAHEVRGSYVQSDGRDSTAPTAAQRTAFDNADASMYTLGYIYHLSRRTALYAVAALIDNKDTGTFSISGGGSITPGGNSTGFMLGTRHMF